MKFARTYRLIPKIELDEPIDSSKYNNYLIEEFILPSAINSQDNDITISGSLYFRYLDSQGSTENSLTTIFLVRTDSNGCIAANDCGFDATLIKHPLEVNIQEALSFSQYPMPANNAINIAYTLPYSNEGVFKIYNINGVEVLSKPLAMYSSTASIDVSTLPVGLYQSVIYTNGYASKSKRVMIQR